MLVNAPVVCASALEELWAGGFASGGVSVDWTIDQITGIDASPRERVSRLGNINQTLKILVNSIPTTYSLI